MTSVGALGPAAGGTTQFSSDTYASGDARTPYVIGKTIKRAPFLKKKKRKSSK